MKKSLRISHYGEHFLLFQNEDGTLSGQEFKMATALDKPVQLEDWIHILRTSKLTSRRDHFFSEPAISC